MKGKREKKEKNREGKGGEARVEARNCGNAERRVASIVMYVF